MSTEQHGEIVAYSLSCVDPNVISVATTKSQIIAWDWSAGRKLGRWKTDAPVYCLTASANGKDKEDTVYTVDKSQTGWEISAHRLRGKNGAKATELISLLKYDAPLKSLKVVDGGRVIVAISSENLVIGKRSGSQGEDLKGLQYSWREIKCPEPPLCFEVQASGNAVDVVIGGLKGCVLVYQNLLQRLHIGKDSSSTLEGAPRTDARELHWHREGVAAVAWSLDGTFQNPLDCVYR